MSKFVKRCVATLIQEYKNKPLEFWEGADFPITFERSFESKVVQVEIDLLESTPEYLQVGIIVGAGWRSWFYPFGKTIIVQKNRVDGKEEDI